MTKNKLTAEQRKTYCPRLWTESFIFEDGNVFACCHEKPKPLGNINKNSLEEIYNGKLMQETRTKSLTGKLSCYKNCSLLKEEEFEDSTTDIIAPYELLDRLKIQFGQDCNINCIMCYQVKNKRGNPSNSYEALVSNVNLEPFQVVEMQGGEPLFIESARNYIEHVIENDTQITLVTNGIILNKKWTKKIIQNAFSYNVY